MYHRKLLHMSMLNAVIISGMSIVSFIYSFFDRNVMLRSVSDRIDWWSPGVCVWEIGRGLPGLCFFLGNPYVLQTWAGTDRVDVSVQLLVSLIIGRTAVSDDHALPRTTTHDHARPPRTTTHDRARPRTTTHDHARPRTTTHDQARPSHTTTHYHARPCTTTTTHDHARPRTTTHDHARPRTNTHDRRA